MSEQNLTSNFTIDLQIFAKIPNISQLSQTGLFLLGHAFCICKSNKSCEDLTKLAQLLISLGVLHKGHLVEDKTLKQIYELLYDGKFIEACHLFENIGTNHDTKPNSEKPIIISDNDKSNENSAQIKENEIPDLVKIHKLSDPLHGSNQSDKSIIIVEDQKNNDLQKNSDTQKAENSHSQENLQKLGKRPNEDLKINPQKREKYDEDEKEPFKLEKKDSMDPETKKLIEKLQEEDKQEVEKRRKSEEDFSCPICLEPILPKEFFPLDSCEHMMHAACLGQHIKIQLEQRNFPIICPMDKCKKELNVYIIKELLDKSDFIKFEEYTFKSTTEKHPDEFSCCPTPDCPYVFVYIQGEDSARFDCPKCKKRYCLNCKVPFHEGMNCKEYEITNTHSVFYKIKNLL